MVLVETTRQGRIPLMQSVLTAVAIGSVLPTEDRESLPALGSTRRSKPGLEHKKTGLPPMVGNLLLNKEPFILQILQDSNL